MGTEVAIFTIRGEIEFDGAIPRAYAYFKINHIQCMNF